MSKAAAAQGSRIVAETKLLGHSTLPAPLAVIDVSNPGLLDAVTEMTVYLGSEVLSTRTLTSSAVSGAEADATWGMRLARPFSASLCGARLLPAWALAGVTTRVETAGAKLCAQLHSLTGLRDCCREERMDSNSSSGAPPAKKTNRASGKGQRSARENNEEGHERATARRVLKGLCDPKGSKRRIQVHGRFAILHVHFSRKPSSPTNQTAHFTSSIMGSLAAQALR